MPHQITSTKNTFSCSFSGEVTNEEIEKAIADFSSNPNATKFEKVLIDFSHIECSRIKPNSWHFAAAHDIGLTLSMQTPPKFAFVANDQSVIDFLKNYKGMVDSSSANVMIELFSDRLSAEKWLE